MTETSLKLPQCEDCYQPHWPPREICPHCLGGSIALGQVNGGGEVLTSCILHHSLSAELRAHLPLHVGTVALDCGVRVIAYLADGPRQSGARVRVAMGSGPSGKDTLLATPEDANS